MNMPIGHVCRKRRYVVIAVIIDFFTYQVWHIVASRGIARNIVSKTFASILTSYRIYW